MSQTEDWLSHLNSSDEFEVRFKPQILEKFAKSAPKIAVLASNEYEIISKNGGIGTYYTALSRKLAEDGWYVILLICQNERKFEGDSQIPALAHIFSPLEAVDVLELNPIHLEILETARQDSVGVWFDYQSFCCFLLVRAIVSQFPDSLVYVEFAAIWGFGYRTIQAKHAGLLGQKCLTAVTTHGSFEWLREINRRYVVNNIPWLWRSYHYEQVSYEQADLTFFPSYFLMEKEKSYGWRAPHAQNLPYFIPHIDLTTTPDRITELLEGELKTDKICVIFFGRLEERKGLCTFVEGIKQLEPSISEKIQVIFLGKIVSLESPKLSHLNSQEYIDREFGNEVPYKIFTDFFSQEAISLINGLSHPIVCLTSLQENFPNTALEMGQIPISIVASDTGGFRETLGLLSRTDCVRWFEPGDSHSFRETIAEAIAAHPETPLVPTRESFDEVDRRLLKQRLEFMDEKLTISKEPSNPKVTIGITGFEPDESFLQCLVKLDRQTYQNLEVLVLYQTSPEMETAIATAREKFPNYQFIESDENLSLGAAYNLLVELATGEYCLHFLTHNTALPFMVEKFAEAAVSADADAIVALQMKVGSQVKAVNLMECSLLKLLEFDRDRDVCALFSKQLLTEFKYSEIRELQAVNWHLVAAAIATGKQMAYYPYPLYLSQDNPQFAIDLADWPKERYYLRQYLSQIDSSKWAQRQLNLLLSGMEQLLQGGQSHAQVQEVQGALDWQKAEAEKWKAQMQAWMETAYLMQDEIEMLQTQEFAVEEVTVQ
ncbi:glycosyltransferase [Zarconia navalis]|nr:glycosyltransferase [Zarconia navalis]